MGRRLSMALFKTGKCDWKSEIGQRVYFQKEQFSPCDFESEGRGMCHKDRNAPLLLVLFVCLLKSMIRPFGSGRLQQSLTCRPRHNLRRPPVTQIIHGSHFKLMFTVGQVRCGVSPGCAGSTVHILAVQFAFEVCGFIRLPSYCLSWVVRSRRIVACYRKNRTCSV